MEIDRDLAWRLADELAGSLGEDERTAVYVELGCGHQGRAITLLLHAAVRDGLVVPGSLVRDVKRWLDFYAGNVDEPPIRDLVKQIRFSVTVHDGPPPHAAE
jgi:hypothetical protein